MTELTKTEWIYNGDFLNKEEVPEDAIGFIYLMTQKSTGKKYIGRKLLTGAASKQVKGKVKKFRIESDWVNYWSSSPGIKEYINEHGKEDFEREILVFTYGKAETNYMEEKFQFALCVMETDNWLNNNIRSKFFRRWFKNFKAIDDSNKKIEELQLRMKNT